MMKKVFSFFLQFVGSNKQSEVSGKVQIEPEVEEKIAKTRKRVDDFLDVPNGLSNFNAPCSNVRMGACRKLILTAKDAAEFFSQKLHVPVAEQEVSLLFLQRNFDDNVLFKYLGYCWVYKEYYISLQECCEYGFFDVRMYGQQTDKIVCTTLLIKPEYYLDLLIEKQQIKPRGIRYFLWHEKYLEDRTIMVFNENATIEETLKSCEYVKKFA